MTPVFTRSLKAATLIAALAIWPLSAAPATGQAQTSPGLASPAPAAVDPEETLVEELVVSSNLGGPAFWKVSDGDTVIWIMGVPGALPRGVSWDSRRLENRLKGADALILPPRIKARPLVITGFFLTHQKAFQGGAPLDGALAARLERDREALRVKPARIAKWKPGVAGTILAGELRRPLHMDDEQPMGRILSLARKARVRSLRAGAAIDPMPAVRSLLDLGEAGHRDCLEDALDEVEAGRERIRSAALGWARGDVRVALTAERGFDRCLARLPTLATMSRRAMADTSGTLARQMTRPGKAVAIVDLRQLLARGGVLDQLKARGFRVETPASAG